MSELKEFKELIMSESSLINEYRLDRNQPYLVIESVGGFWPQERFEKIIGLAIRRFNYMPVGNVEIIEGHAFKSSVYRQAIYKNNL